MMKSILISRLTEELMSIHPYKIILFGSYATGGQSINSDIDLLVITNSDHFPVNYKEKSEEYLKVSEVISEIKKQVAVDLIVYTKPMYKKFVELGSMFSKEIESKGIVLYEDSNQRLA
ncbi:MAG: nucleotidyltransferase domain-containing protein [Bacteroidetes bacterium]|nr:nucleotidyltransferase domain-containing protein [Bacteroidota bacterium]